MQVSLKHVAPNLTRVDIGNAELWFSYETLVAFQVSGFPQRVCKNVWSVTTGKHLNRINADKSQRLGADGFAAAIAAELGAL